MSTTRRTLSAQGRSLAHRAAAVACASAARAFEGDLRDVRASQVERLGTVLRAVEGTAHARRWGLRPGLRPEQYREAVPESTYADLAADIEAQRSGAPHVLTHERCTRYQPTSGSSSKVKWIPYTEAFLGELDAAISPWVHDLYQSIPGVRQGRHYWSLSWVPTHLRAATDANVNDDRALLSWSKRLFSAVTSPVPPWVAYTDTSEEASFATLCFLAAADDLSVMSVWSPTFALNLFEQLAEHRLAVAAVLEAGAFGASHPGLSGRAPRSIRGAQMLRGWDGALDSAFFSELWPSLALVSAWDTSSSAQWAHRLEELLPHARFQGKGLWATEGVVTIPYRGRYPLSLRSHYYEFVDLETERCCFSWELERGQRVRPLLSTGSGLLRYALKDRLEVSDFLGTTPCFRFLGRIDDVDMVGEKMSPEVAQEGLDATRDDGLDGVTPLSLLALMPTANSEKPRYVALCEGPCSSLRDEVRSARLEAVLRGTFHYALARDLGQLGPARALTVPDARRLYEQLGVSRGMVAGNIKLEPLVLCAGAPPVALIEARLPSGSTRPSPLIDRRL